jgi:hypothetical protein
LFLNNFSRLCAIDPHRGSAAPRLSFRAWPGVRVRSFHNGEMPPLPARLCPESSQPGGGGGCVGRGTLEKNWRQPCLVSGSGRSGIIQDSLDFRKKNMKLTSWS